MRIVKANGEIEKFQQKKIISTLRRAGASQSAAKEITRKIAEQIKSGDSTRRVLKLALNYLEREQPIVAGRYDLKQAIMRLGPSGFIFEKVVARLLEENRYQARMPELLKGKCVEHEVDILASKNNREYMVECKYRNEPGIYIGIKDVLYLWGRWLDLIEAGHKLDQLWIVSNVQFSRDALAFAKCRRFKVTSWDYPARDSLSELITNRHLYPITIIRKLKIKERDELIDHNYIFCRDLVQQSFKKLKRDFKIPRSRLKFIVNQANLFLDS